jgi:predicted GNAT family acetyltransferase
MKIRKMKQIKLVEMQKEWWGMYEVGPNGFYTTDYESNPVINAWHSYSFWGARLFELVHDGEVVSFCAAKFYKTKSEVHIYLNYVPKSHRGKGHGKEMKRQFFELVKKEGFSTITVDCQTPGGDRLYSDGIKRYEELAQ